MCFNEKFIAFNLSHLNYWIILIFLDLSNFYRHIDLSHTSMTPKKYMTCCYQSINVLIHAIEVWWTFNFFPLFLYTLVCTCTYCWKKNRHIMKVNVMIWDQQTHFWPIYVGNLFFFFHCKFIIIFFNQIWMKLKT